MALFVKCEMFETLSKLSVDDLRVVEQTLSKLSVDDLRVVEQMVSFPLLRDRSAETPPVDVQRYELTIGEDYERWLKETQGERDLKELWPESGNPLIEEQIYTGNTCESSVNDIEQLVESLITRKEEIEHV